MQNECGLARQSLKLILDVLTRALTKPRRIQASEMCQSVEGAEPKINREFDHGSGRTLAACLTHASRASGSPSGEKLAADG